MRAIGQHDVFLDGRQFVGDLFQKRHEGDVDEHHAVFGMIDDPDDLVGKQPRIDGVVDRADAENAVPGLQMPPGVPGQGGDAVAELDAVPLQPLRHFQRAGANLRIIGLDNRPLDRAGDDLALAVEFGGMVDNAVQQQRKIRHQAEHGDFLSQNRFLFWAVPSTANAQVNERANPCKVKPCCPAQMPQSCPTPAQCEHLW